MRIAAFCLLGVLLASRAHAQEPTAPEPTVAHRFFDRMNIALIVTESTALLADGIYTQRALKNYPEIFREADPIARPFVMNGWPGQIAGGALFVSADVGLRYLFHRAAHHRIERLVPMILTIYGTVGAIHGARELRRVERDYEMYRAETR